MTIADVSKKYELSIDTLRYYERVGLIPPVSRNKSGFRDYTETDIRWVNFIKCMRNAGVSIEALASYVSLFQQGESTHKARKELLKKELASVEVRLEELQKNRDVLKWKVDHYDDRLKLFQDNLMN